MFTGENHNNICKYFQNISFQLVRDANQELFGSDRFQFQHQQEDKAVIRWKPIYKMNLNETHL